MKQNIPKPNSHNLHLYSLRPLRISKNSLTKCSLATFKSSYKNTLNPKNKNKFSGIFPTINQFISLHKKIILIKEGKNNQIPSFIPMTKKLNPCQENFKSIRKITLPNKTNTADQMAPNHPAWFQCLRTAKTENTWNAQIPRCFPIKTNRFKEHHQHLFSLRPQMDSTEIHHQALFWIKITWKHLFLILSQISLKTFQPSNKPLLNPMLKDTLKWWGSNQKQMILFIKNQILSSSPVKNVAKMKGLFIILHMK